MQFLAIFDSLAKASALEIPNSTFAKVFATKLQTHLILAKDISSIASSIVSVH